VFPEWTWVVGFYIGATIGSFLNVVIYRLPRGLKLSQPTYSFCPKCENRLTFADLLPLLSWLFLRGKCRHCKAGIPSRYFWVELITASFFALIWWQQLVAGQDWIRAVGFSMFAAALVAAIFTDLAHYIIPDQVNAWMLGVGLAMNACWIGYGLPDAWIAVYKSGGSQWALPSSVAGALAGIAVLWGIAFFGRLFFRKDAMGHGDIKMARGIGAVLLPSLAFISFGLAVALGAIFGVVILLLRRGSSEPTPSQDEGSEPELPPESLTSLLWCGLGYVLCIDVIGLFFPKVYEWWFGENPYSVEEIEEDPVVELTMIPFGPYLAAGALGAVLFGPQLMGLVQAYWRSVAG